MKFLKHTQEPHGLGIRRLLLRHTCRWFDVSNYTAPVTFKSEVRPKIMQSEVNHIYHDDQCSSFRGED